MSVSDSNDSDLPEGLESLPVLIEAPKSVDSSSASEIGEMFSQATLTTNIRKVSVLEDLFSAVTKDCNFTEFVNEILFSIMQAVKCEAGSIFELNPTNNILFFRGVVGSSSDLIVNFVVPMGHGIVGRVAETRTPIIVDNAPENQMHLKTVEKVVGFETRNLVALPLLVRGQIYGVLELLNRVGESNFSIEDMELLTYLSRMSAKAIEIRLMIAWAQKERERPGMRAA